MVVRGFGLGRRSGDGDGAKVERFLRIHGLAMQGLMRMSRIDDVTVFGARDVTYDQHVAKRQELGSQQQKAGGVHGEPPGPPAATHFAHRIYT
jgi:hypothetical protein